MQLFLDNYIIPVNFEDFNVMVFEEIIEKYDLYYRFAYNPKSRKEYIQALATFIDKNQPKGYTYTQLLKEYFQHVNYDLLCLKDYDLIEELNSAKQNE
jgi:hypothetical protein